tara:strand:+ start:171 stop:455 length:285 start_codon:yes stop_codon:yes gene_type:complete
MNSSRISYADMLVQTKSQDHLLRPEPFSIAFVTCNRNKKTGGEIIRLDNAVRVGQKHNTVANKTIGVKQLGNTHHPYAVHTRLILEFNNRKVFY